MKPVLILSLLLTICAEVLEGYKLIWNDEFDGNEIDTTKWGYDLGGSGWGNNEFEYYTE